MELPDIHSTKYAYKITSAEHLIFSGLGASFSNWVLETNGVADAEIMPDAIHVSVYVEADGAALHNTLLHRFETFKAADEAALSAEGLDALPPAVRGVIEKTGISEEEFMNELVVHLARRRTDSPDWRRIMHSYFHGMAPHLSPTASIGGQLPDGARRSMNDAGWDTAKAIGSLMRLARQSGPLSHDRITSHIQSEIEAEQQAVLGAGR